MANSILNSWEMEKLYFWQIVPKDMVNKFEKPVLIKEAKLA